MDPADRTSRRIDAAWLILCGVASSLWIVTASARLGPTFDETIYLDKGLQTWRGGSHRLA